MICQFYTCEPLGILFTITPRDQDAHWIAVPLWQFHAIHAPCQQGVSRQHFVERQAHIIAIDGIESDITCFWSWATMLLQQGLERYPLPDGSAHQAYIRAIGNTFQGNRARRRWQLLHFFISI